VKQANERDFRYQGIMRNLVRRYVTVEQRKAESQGVTEDDVNEIKQDISAFRCELVEILKNSGMNTSSASGQGSGPGGKKNRQKERRLMKGFNIAPPPQNGTGNLTPVHELLLSDQQSQDIFGTSFSGAFPPGITPRKNGGQQASMHQYSTSQSSFGDSTNTLQKLSRFAPKFHAKRSSQKRKWGKW
jgi:transient receptor potential cation channel subfamily C member 4